LRGRDVLRDVRLVCVALLIPLFCRILSPDLFPSLVPGRKCTVSFLSLLIFHRIRFEGCFDESSRLCRIFLRSWAVLTGSRNPHVSLISPFVPHFLNQTFDLYGFPPPLLFHPHPTPLLPCFPGKIIAKDLSSPSYLPSGVPVLLRTKYSCFHRPYRPNAPPLEWFFWSLFPPLSLDYACCQRFTLLANLFLRAPAGSRSVLLTSSDGCPTFRFFFFPVHCPRRKA